VKIPDIRYARCGDVSIAYQVFGDGPDHVLIRLWTGDLSSMWEQPLLARYFTCACAVRDAVRRLGRELRIGLHTGECELLGDKLAGIAINTGARVAAKAAPGEVLVSRTVKDLVAGSGIEFEERGTHELKGLAGEWQLYAVSSAE